MSQASRNPISSLRERWQAEHFPDPLQRDSIRTRPAQSPDADLSELRAASPADDDRDSSHIEDGRGRQSRLRDDQDGLNEVSAPRPARKEQRSGSYLEDRGVTMSRQSSGFWSRIGQQIQRPQESPRPNLSQPENKEADPTKPDMVYSPALTELYTISWLIFFSFWGTLARLGVEAITLYPNSPFPSRVLWANLGGSFFIGFLTEDRRLFQEEWGSPDLKAEHAAHVKVKKTIPLYIGLATGFCGCFTSFSSFIKDAFLALSNALASPSPTTAFQTETVINSRNGGFSFLAVLAVLIIEPSVSISALKAGAHFALLLEPITPTIPHRFGRKVLDPIITVLAFGCWLAAIFLSIWPPGNDIHWRFRGLLPVAFSPVGCMLRFYLSRHLNGRLPSFPLGTFVANILGTAILGMAYDLQHARGIAASPDGSPGACSVLQGVIEGFCGCLTTVSTWVLELDGLRRRHAWFYGLTSVVVGLALLVVIMGSMGWTVGFASPMCS